jgi:cytochrome P450
VSTANADHKTPVSSKLANFYSWRRMRRASHEAFTKVAVQRYQPIQTKEATILVSALLANPENREQHVKRAATSTIMSVLYDYPTLASAQDKAVQDMDRSMHWVSRAAVWFFVIQLFPWMMHIPERSTPSPQLLHSYLNTGQVF